jgi:Mrp family chromosome partitioning ATPase
MTALDQAIIRKLSQKSQSAPTDWPNPTMAVESLLSELAGPLDAAATLSATEPAAAPPPAAPEPAAPPAAPAAAWRPRLQVDSLVWPNTANRLQVEVVAAMDRFVEGLTSILRSGRKVLGFGSSTHGEGVTTLLLAAARRLAAQDLRVALVDANPAKPGLAQSLGVLPQVGWEESLSGRLPLEEVAIESITDRLTLVPLREEEKDQCNSTQRPATDVPRVAADLAVLAQNYDAVLLDLGPLETEAAAEAQMGTVPFFQVVCQCLDAFILVHSVRATTPDRIEQLEEKLAAAGIACAVTVQNFVAG